jgi:hypothetical protein
MIMLELATISAACVIAGFALHVLNRYSTALIAMQSHSNRLEANIERIALRLQSIEQILQREIDYLPSVRGQKL